MRRAADRSAWFPWRYFALATAVSWIIWLPGVLATQGVIKLPVPFIVFFFAGTWGPFVAASFEIYSSDGLSGLKQFLKRGFDRTFSPWWLLVMLGLALSVTALPLGIWVLLGGVRPEQTLLATPGMILPVFLTYFVTGGANEEWGWRGFALDRLQDRLDPLRASVLLGVLWGIWHVPLFFIEDTGQYHMSLLVFMLAAPASSILHTWIYNGAGRKMLAAWLFHAAIGTAWEVFPLVQPNLDDYRPVHIYSFAAVVLVSVVVTWLTGARLGAVAQTEQTDASSI